MKQKLFGLWVVFVLVSGLFLVSSTVRAMTPTLSINATGNGDSATISTYGDPYASVILYYQNQGYSYGAQSQYIGTTNSSGYLSTTISASTYGITAGSNIYVLVNGQTSSTVVWPYNYNNYGNYNYGYGTVSLSQTNVTVSVGQSVSVTIYGGNAPYTIFPSGANIFQAVIGGNNLQIAGLNSGNGSLSVCSLGGSGSGCAILYVSVNVGNYYNNPPLYNPVMPAITFSQNNPTLSVGQSMTITVSGLTPYNYYGGSYYIAHNSNSNVASAVLNGSTMTLQGIANGNVAVVVCLLSTNCSALNITVGANNYNNYGNNSGNWNSCAGENQYCSFSGTQNVRYGANGTYVYRMITNGTTCSNAVFGDPIFGVAKQCSIGGY